MRRMPGTGSPKMNGKWLTVQKKRKMGINDNNLVQLCTCNCHTKIEALNSVTIDANNGTLIV